MNSLTVNSLLFVVFWKLQSIRLVSGCSCWVLLILGLWMHVDDTWLMWMNVVFAVCQQFERVNVSRELRFW